MEIQNVELHRVVSTAIIHKDGKYLIVQRNPNKKVFPGRWTVPGGGLEVTDYINTPKTTPRKQPINVTIKSSFMKYPKTKSFGQPAAFINPISRIL